MTDTAVDEKRFLVGFIRDDDPPNSWRFFGYAATSHVAAKMVEVASGLPGTFRAFAQQRKQVQPEHVDSTGDDRVVNNIMRHEYRVLSTEEKGRVGAIKDYGVAFTTLCDKIGQSRELSLAKTKMEEAVMWAVKHVTR